MGWRQILKFQQRAKSGLIIPTHCELQRDWCVAFETVDGIRTTFDRGMVSAISMDWRDLDAAIRAVLPGQTVAVPNGAAPWTNSGTGPIQNQVQNVISFAGIRVWASGATALQNSRVEGISATSVTLPFTGSMTFTLRTEPIRGFVSWINGFNVGESVTVRANGHGSDATGNWMKGTITAWNPGTAQLTVNVTSSQGAGTFGAGTFASPFQWVFDVLPAGASVVTTTNSLLSLLSVGSHPAFPTQLRGFKIVNGGTTSTVDNTFVKVVPTPGNFLPQMRDCHISGNGPGGTGGAHAVAWNSDNGGIYWNCYMDGGFEWIGQPNSLNIGLGIAIKHHQGAPGQAVWATNATTGTLDVANQPGASYGGATNVYIESSFVTGHNTQHTDSDDNCRLSMRHCVLDTSGMASHGADTSTVGNRHTELESCWFLYADNGGTTNTGNPSTGWFQLRGAELIISNCSMDTVTVSNNQWNNNTEVNLQIQAPYRGSNLYGCQTTYPFVNENGQGYVNGNATVECWFWNLTMTANSHNTLVRVALQNSPSNTCNNPNPLSFWMQNGRDYEVDASCSYNQADGLGNIAGPTTHGGAKPGYLPYQFPHPGRV